ncbi:MAG TPA: type I restriction enzyme HsdR N-terminal domain-containing protein [Sedimentisphaerales bacterium]
MRFELNTATGRADYLLNGQRGPLCVLEGKREGLDPYDVKEQARGYAENVKAPFIILSNGREHWFWNYTRPDQDAYRIERLPSRFLSEIPGDLLNQWNLRPSNSYQ